MSDETFRYRTARYYAPQSMPTDYICRRIILPRDFDISAAVSDVLVYLAQPGVWIPSNNVSDADMQAFMSEMFFSFVTLAEDIDVIAAIIPMFTDVLPDHMLWCEGQTLDRLDYPDLYARVPAFFRIDADTFMLPDLRAQFLFGADGSTYQVGNTGGEETHTLTVSEIPAHHHAYDPVIVGDLDVEGAGVPQPNAAQIIPAVTENTYDEGGGEAHENMPPFFVIRWAIVAKKGCC